MVFWLCSRQQKSTLSGVALLGRIKQSQRLASAKQHSKPSALLRALKLFDSFSTEQKAQVPYLHGTTSLRNELYAIRGHQSLRLRSIEVAASGNYKSFCLGPLLPFMPLWSNHSVFTLIRHNSLVTLNAKETQGQATKPQVCGNPLKLRLITVILRQVKTE